MSQEKTGHSGAWYLLPIFFAVIGGIIMWIAVHQKDPSMGTKGIIVGIVMTILPFFVMFIPFAFI
jgi:hypothetical protein|tara:strand:- start:58 stop:252 length:195 start_codon:yes stop_codon:yes gene_type:complete